MAVKVGTFQKSTDAAPVDQAITGLGFTPDVVLLFTTGQTSINTSADGYSLAFGASTGASNSYSVSISSQDNVSDSNVSDRIAAKALTIIQYGESLLAECDMKSFDGGTGGFTLTWTTNDANAYHIGYVALAGVSLTNAKIVTWAAPTGTGDQAVTDVGFQPDAVLHFWTKETSAPTTGAGHALGFGLMTAAASASASVASTDDAGTTAAGRGVDNNDPLFGVLASDAADFLASYVSMDLDGFTVNFSNGAAAGYLICSLCLKGGSYHVGTFTDTFQGPGNYPVTGVGFQPEGVLFTNVFTQSSNMTMQIGAGDGTNQASAYAFDQDGQGTSNTKSRQENNDIIQAVTSAALPYETAQLVSLDADGYTLDFTDQTFITNIFRYLALALGAASAVSARPAQVIWI